MHAGGETTREEDFLFNPDVVEFLDQWQGKLDEELALDRLPSRKVRARLEAFAWALKQKIEEEGW